MRHRVIVSGAALGFSLAGALSISSALAVPDWWQGSWSTSSVAGPLLVHFEQNERKVTGRYRSGPGCIGLIEAKAEGSNGQHLVGTFDDRCPATGSENNRGQLRVTVDFDERPLKFTGKFRECGRFTCGDWYRWIGRKR